MRQPHSGDQLQQFICAANWMRSSIPDFSRVTAPLSNLMEKVYRHAGSRKTRSVAKIKLFEHWEREHTTSFELVKKQLAHTVELAHPKSGFRICLFTDASDTHWSAILTQSPIEERRKPLEQQSHEPLSFLSGSFKGHSANWSVPEKEGYAIVEAMDRLNYLVSGRTVSMYTDHANLLYILDPFGARPSIPRHTASKLTRWAIKLSMYRFEIEHAPGDRNVWAYLLTRCAVQTPSTFNPTAVMGKLMIAPVDPGIHKEYDWPSIEDIKSSQRKEKNRPSNLKFYNSVWRTKEDKVWVPPDDKDLQLRLLIAAHTGTSGHHAASTTHVIITKHFWWNNITKSVEIFVRSYLHCCATSSGSEITRPLGHAVHATRPNELIHFDFCYLGKAEIT